MTPGGKTRHFGSEGDLEPLGTTVGQREDPRSRQTKRDFGRGKHTQTDHTHNPRTELEITSFTKKVFKKQVY